MVPAVRGSQGMSGNFTQVRESQEKISKSEKVREFYIPKSGKNEMVRESQGKSKYQGAKVNKDAEKSLNCFTQTAYNRSNFFPLPSLIDYLYLHF